jgi:ATP-binding cassette subfamily B protein
MHPDTGSCYYTDRHGDGGELTSAYRRMFAYVPQGNYLMSGTIREIVAFAEPSAASDEERLYKALRIACADGFVSELDQGADTLLGERGAGLSEGQMQRIAIARAIFSGSPILLLDEATSALDAATEKQLLENLRSMTDKTVVIVTHRPAALSICDRVLEFTESGIIIRS